MKIHAVCAALLTSVGVFATPGLAQAATNAAPSGELVIYSGRKEALLKPILEDFTKQTGIKVNVKYGKDSQLVNQLLEEKDAMADGVVVSDATMLEELSGKGKLETLASKEVSKVPTDAVDPNKQWVGISRRARVLLVNKNLLKPSEYPKSMLELTDKKWEGKVASTGLTQSSFVAQIAGMKALLGEKTTLDWLQGLKNNKVTWFDEHTQVRKAVGKGEFAVGIVNHYYGHLEMAEGSPVEIVYPDQESTGKTLGALYNYACIGKVKGAKNAANLEKLVDYLLTPETQKKFAELNFEFPVLNQVAVKEGVKKTSEVKFSKVSIEQMAAERTAVTESARKIGL